MNLDPTTLLFALVVANAMAMLSLLVAMVGNRDGRRDGMGKWAAAMLLETLTWVMVAARGTIPDVYTIVLANLIKAGAHALILAAICEFQHRRAPAWQYVVPLVLATLMAAVLIDDLRGRFVWGGLIFGFQVMLIGRALLADPETRVGQAWRLLFVGVILILLVLALRAGAALFGHQALAQPQDSVAPHPVQIFAFLAIMATALLGTFGFLLMIKERGDREILHMAMTDSLTRVPNRRALIEQAEHALARRGGLPLALLMIDVDHFKRINDIHGHPTGDEVLRKVAERLMGRLRGQDILGRYGGEEFCVIAPDTHAEGAHRLAESLRETIASTPLRIEHGAFRVTVSVGYALCPAASERTLKKLLAEADIALYAAKQAGRDRVACFAPYMIPAPLPRDPPAPEPEPDNRPDCAPGPVTAKAWS